MSAFELTVHPDAIIEAGEARHWYHNQNPSVAEKFELEIEKSFVALLESPERWPSILSGHRRIRLRRFPFMIVYYVRGNNVFVVAIAHMHRRPGYWMYRGFGDEN